jgi:hypothetical protein
VKIIVALLFSAELLFCQQIDWVKQVKNKPIIDVREFGAKGDGITDDSAAIQAAIEYQRTNKKAATLYIPAGVYIACNLTVYPATKIEGASSAGSITDAANSYSLWPVTILLQKAACNADVIKGYFNAGNQGWHHGLQITSLHVMGQPGSNTTGNGINLYRLGENALIDRVYVTYMPENGIRIWHYSAPLHIGNVSVMNNGAAGIALEGSLATENKIDFVSGDNNGTALVKITDMATVGLTIGGFKSERSSNSFTNSPGNPKVIWVHNGNLGILTIMSGHVYSPPGTAAGDAIIYQSADALNATADVKILGAISMDSAQYATYSYGYNDTFNAKTETVANFIGTSMTSGLSARPSIFDGYSFRWFNGHLGLVDGVTEVGQFDKRGAITIGLATPTRPNIISVNPVNFGTEAQGGFISVNSRFTNTFPNWEKTSTGTYNRALFMRLGAAAFDISFGAAANTGGATPGTRAFGVLDDASTGYQTVAQAAATQTRNIWQINDSSGVGHVWVTPTFMLRTDALQLRYAGIVAAASPYAVLDTDVVIGCDATAGAITINLPTAVGVAGRLITVKKVDTSGNACTVSGTGGELIDGSGTYALSAGYKYVSVVSSDIRWLITANN